MRDDLKICVIAEVKMNDIEQWIDSKLLEIAEKLPGLVHSDPASFACGYNSGYKKALIELDMYIQELKNKTIDCI